MNRFFFMHIPKTAGTFVNGIFKKSLGDEFSDQCEAPSRSFELYNTKFVSGHIYLPHWKSIASGRGWEVTLFTLLRDPLRQLASHILWLDHYGEQKYRGEYDELGREDRYVVESVRATNFLDAGSIDNLLVNLEDRGIQYFDNCQSRYFIADEDTIRWSDPLHLGLRDRLAEAVHEFEVVGTDKDLPGFILDVSNCVGCDMSFEESPSNVKKSARSIDLGNAEILEVLSKRITLDNWLYSYVTDARDNT